MCVWLIFKVIVITTIKRLPTTTVVVVVVISISSLLYFYWQLCIISVAINWSPMFRVARSTLWQTDEPSDHVYLSNGI